MDIRIVCPECESERRYPSAVSLLESLLQCSVTIARAVHATWRNGRLPRHVYINYTCYARCQRREHKPIPRPSSEEGPASEAPTPRKSSRIWAEWPCCGGQATEHTSLLTAISFLEAKRMARWLPSAPGYSVICGEI